VDVSKISSSDMHLKKLVFVNLRCVGKCASKGAAAVVITPYFLSKGRHIQEDIPKLVKEAQLKHTSVLCTIAEPIGIDPLMAQLICNRVNEAMDANADLKALLEEKAFESHSL
jgi:sirohydrochlorin ferrochelatase